MAHVVRGTSLVSLWFSLSLSLALVVSLSLVLSLPLSLSLVVSLSLWFSLSLSLSLGVSLYSSLSLWFSLSPPMFPPAIRVVIWFRRGVGVDTLLFGCSPATEQQDHHVQERPADGLQPHRVPLPDRVRNSAQGRPGGAQEESHRQD